MCFDVTLQEQRLASPQTFRKWLAIAPRRRPNLIAIRSSRPPACWPRSRDASVPGRPLWRPPGCAAAAGGVGRAPGHARRQPWGAAPAFQRRTRMTSPAIKPSWFRRPMCPGPGRAGPGWGVARPLRATTRDRGTVSARQQSVIHVSLDELAHRGGPADYQPLAAVDVPMLVRSDVALPFLLDECRRQLQGTSEIAWTCDASVSRTAGGVASQSRQGWCRLTWRERVSRKRG